MPSHPVDVYVGRRLRLRRTILGMSQETLGNAIGVTFQQIQKYERGLNRIGSSRLFDFCKVMGVSVSYFFDGLDAEQSVEDGKEELSFKGLAEDTQTGFEYEQLTSRETLELVRAYNRIGDSSVRKSIFELVKSLADENTKKAA